ncbi:reverse transcriptase [Trichonephila clavipes]|nr:reverse transcriptase [Trichonephila clavipes]
MASGSYMTPIYSRSQSEVQGDLPTGPDYMGDALKLPNQGSRVSGESLQTLGPIPRHLETAEAVVRFRLTTGHDFLGVYLHWLGVAANEACPLTCSNALDSMNTRLIDIVRRYWEARRQMVKKPSTGVEK